MPDTTTTFALTLAAGCFAAECVGILLALAYWRWWGRARFDRQLDAAVDAELEAIDRRGALEPEQTS